MILFSTTLHAESCCFGPNHQSSITSLPYADSRFVRVAVWGCKVLIYLEEAVYLSEPSCARLILCHSKQQLTVSVEDLVCGPELFALSHIGIQPCYIPSLLIQITRASGAALYAGSNSLFTP